MHAAITRIAELEGISLNQYMVTAIAQAIGHKEPHLNRNPKERKTTRPKYEF